MLHKPVIESHLNGRRTQSLDTPSLLLLRAKPRLDSLSPTLPLHEASSQMFVGVSVEARIPALDCGGPAGIRTPT